MNILVLAAGHVGLNIQDGGFPLCLTEFDGTPLIEKIIEKLRPLGAAKTIFAFPAKEAGVFHLDNIVRLLAPNSLVLTVNGKTQGALCTALLSIGHINSEDELLVVSANELVDVDLAAVTDSFRDQSYDAGTITFPSIHPRYSYVRINDEGLVIEAAQKNPISRNATTGIFWFARGSDFVEAAKNMVRKDVQVDGSFYICPVFNELVLRQSRIGIFPIEPKQYHPLKSERQIYQFENSSEHGS